MKMYFLEVNTVVNKLEKKNLSNYNKFQESTFRDKTGLKA